MAYQMRQCSAATCRFRFPVEAGSPAGAVCPRCGATTSFSGEPYNHVLFPAGEAGGRAVVEALLDNIRSIYNVGSIFRTADGAGVSHLHLAGITATPRHPKVAKTALGAEQAVPWTAYTSSLLAAQQLKERGCLLWAVEGGARAEPLFAGPPPAAGRPVVLVVGNELAGVDPAVLALCDRVVALPMEGQKRSLNVVVAFGVAVYWVRWGMGNEGVKGEG